MSKVHFVGAGPGAPDLITLRGKELLEQADVIIYAGSLVPVVLLDHARPACETHNSALMTLDEIIAVITAAAAENKRVVRLHTGDPSIYGAIREQIDRLSALNIDYEVCPGVSSFCAAAAALKAEYTLPGISQTVIITRVEGRTPMPEKESLKALAAHGATIVLFLSAGLLEKAVADLTEGGYSPETPAAIVANASWPEEQIIRCPLSEVARSAALHNIDKTALICVGGFLGDDYELSKLYAADFSTGYREATK